MPRRNLLFRLATPTLLAVAALMSNTSSAQAGLISYSHMINQQMPPYSLTFTLTGFDTSLGTLTGVTVTTATSGTANVVVYNFAQQAQSFTNATAQFNFNVTDPSGAGLSTRSRPPPSPREPYAAVPMGNFELLGAYSVQVDHAAPAPPSSSAFSQLGESSPATRAPAQGTYSVEAECHATGPSAVL